MDTKYILSPNRKLTKDEKSLIWQKPDSHVVSEIEKRICNEVKRNWNNKELKIANILLEGDAGSGKTQLAKALSYNFQLPYTKITCFADMDKSDILGSILPDIEEDNNDGTVNYQYYPSEIIRAYENGWILEIQEPTVIRDAGVLMALNSALELDGSINLPTRIIHRHPDFIAIITTNRGYNGVRPLNESLRDRIQHSEKMDLPPKTVMIERAISKTGFIDEEILSLLADSIITLDEVAVKNAIKGVAGMRSYFYWVDAVASGASIKESVYYKVIYKMTTDKDEIAILEQALLERGLLQQMEDIDNREKITNNNLYRDSVELFIETDGEYHLNEKEQDKNSLALRKSKDSTGHSDKSSTESLNTKSFDSGDDGSPIYHTLENEQVDEIKKNSFRKSINKEARESVKDSIHKKVKLVVHCPEISEDNKREYDIMSKELMPIINELTRKTSPLLEYEATNDFIKSRLYGTKFSAELLANKDLRYFSKKQPPKEEPSLAVALRIDESASMTAFGRLEAAKKAAIALYEFCSKCKIPIMIYGDTADRSKLEQMSIYSYVDIENDSPDRKYALMNIQGISNNRDGMALRIIADRFLKIDKKNKIFISISDGQPKAMPDYTNELAIQDMKKVLQEYNRKGIIFLAAAIGQDKDVISHIYGTSNTIDISDLNQLPIRLVQIISRYI